MAGNVDTRVVQLQFENKEFEKNIAKSQKSIEDLKEAMDFEETSRGLDKFSRAFDFSTMENNLQRLTDKFTGLGDAGEYVISRIRSALEGAARDVEYFIKSISVDQIPQGQAKYDSMNKAVMSIVSGGKATEAQAYEIMERVMTYTDQTSHNFQTMVTGIANLTSIGMGLKESELLLEGIGNAATFAGKGAQEAAASMSVLTKVMSPSGFLGYEKFLQLSQTAGVITDKWRQQAIEAGEAVGTLTRKNDKLYVNVKGQKAVEVTAQNLESTLRSRWLTSEVLKKIYEPYQFANSGDWEADKKALEHPQEALDSFGKTAYITGQRALSLADALNAIKESVSSGWMESFRYIFGDVTEAAEHFTNITDRFVSIIEKIKNFRNELLRNFAEQGGRTKLMELLLGDYEKEIGDGTVGLLDLIDGAGSVIRNAFWNFIKLLNPGMMLDPLYSDEKWEKNSEYRMEMLSQMVIRFIDGIKEFFGSIKTWLTEEIDIGGKTTSRLEMLQNIVNGIASIIAFAETVGSEGLNFLNGLGKDLDPSVTAILDLLSKFGFVIGDTVEDMQKAERVRKFFEDLREILTPVTEAINLVTGNLTEMLTVMFGLDDDKSKDRSKALEGFGEVLKTLAKVFATITAPILTFVGDIIKAFTVLMEKGFTAEGFEEFGKSLSEGFSKMIKSFADNLPESFGFIRDFIYDLFGLWEDEAKKKEREGTIGTFLHNLFTNGLGELPGIIGKILGGNFNLTDAFNTGLGVSSAMNWLGTVANFFKHTNLYSILMGFLGVVSIGSILSLITRIKTTVNKILIFFDDVGGNLKNGFTGEYEWFGDRILKIAKAIGILVLCVIALGSMNTGSLIKGVAALAIIMGAMFGLFYLFTGTMKKDSKLEMTWKDQLVVEAMIITFAAAIAVITAAIAVLVLALVPLTMTGWGGFFRAMLSVIIILAALGGFMYLMMKEMQKLVNLNGQGNSLKGVGVVAAMMFTLAASMLILAVAVSVLSIALVPFSIMSWGGWARAMAGLAVMLLLLGTFMVVMLGAVKTLMKTYGGEKGDMAGLGKIALVLIAMAGFMILMSAAIAVLSIALIPFAVMSWGGWARAMAGLAVMLVLIGGFMTVMLTITKSLITAYGKENGSDMAGIGKIALVLIAMAGFMILLSAAVAILSVSLIPFATMTWGGWSRAMAGLAVMLVLIGAFMVIMVNIMSKSFGGFGGGSDIAKIGKMALTLLVLAGFMILLGVAVGLITLALTPLALMDWGPWARAVIGFGIILAEIVGLLYLVKAAKVEGVKLAGFIGFALSLAILMHAIKLLAELKPEQMVQGIVGLATVMLMMVVLLAIINELKPDLKTAGTTLLMLVGLGAAMLLFAVAFNEVKDVKWETMVAFAGGLSVLLIAIAFASTLAKVGGIKGMLVLAIGLAAIMLVISLLAPMLISGIATGLAEAAGQLVVMSNLLQTFSSNMDQVDEGAMDKAKRIVSIMGELLLLMGGFAFFGGVFVNFTEAVSQLTLVSGLAITMTNRFKQLDVEAVNTAIVFVNKVKALVEGPLSAFKSETDAFDNFTAAVSQLTLASGLAIDMTDRINSIDPEAIKTFKTFAGDIKGLFSEDGPLSGFGDYLGSAQQFSSVMYELGTGAETLNNHAKNIDIDPDNNFAIKTIQKLSACAGDLDVIAKMNIDDLTAKISGLGGAMILYAQGAKEATGLGEIEDAPDVTAAIELMTAITTGLADKGGIVLPENMPETDTLGLFGAQLAALAAALVQFEQAGAGLGTGTDKALGVLEFFQQLKEKLETTNFAENMSALDSFGTGEEAKNKAGAIETFGKNIEQLGQSLGQFANSTTYVDEQTGEIMSFDYSRATTALTEISEVANSLPSFGGALEIVTGVKDDLDKFAGQIEALGKALGDFHKNTSSMDAANNTEYTFDYSNATAALSAIAGVADTLPRFGSPLEILIGEKENLTKFAGEIEALGQALNDFHSKTTTMDEVNKTEMEFNYDNAIKALTSLSELPGKMPKRGGLAALLEGDETSLTAWAGDIVGLGAGLQEFSKSIKGDEEHPGFDPTIVNPTIEAVDKMIEFTTKIQTRLPKIGGIVNFFDEAWNGHKISLKELGDQIGSMGEGLGQFGEKVSGKFKDMESVSNALSAVSTLVDIMTVLATLNEKAYTGDFGAYARSLVEFLEVFSEGFKNGFAEGTEHKSAVDSIVEIMSAISDAVAKAGNINADSLVMFDTMASALANLSKIDTARLESFKEVGKSIATGIASGIEDGTTIVQTAAAKIAVEAYNSAMKALDAHSPSKVFMQVGDYIGMGMAIGIDKSTDDVIDSATGMTDKTIETAQTLAATISRIMAEEADANPTISPVLDLTNIRDSASEINSILGNGQYSLDNSGRNPALWRHVTLDPQTSQQYAASLANTDLSRLENVNQKDYTGSIDSLISETKAQRKDIENLGTAISHLKIVMDRGAVVGAIAPEIDAYLGQKEFYASRTDG